jgi:hypothetical protein
MSPVSQLEYDGSKPLKDGRRELFCQEAVIRNDLNSAFEAAGFKRPRGNAHRMSREPKVEARLAYLWKQGAQGLELMAGRWLAKADLIALANMRDFWEIDEATGEPTRLNLNKVSHALTGAIQEISYDAQGRPKIKLHDSPSMLRFLIEKTDPSVKKIAMTDPSGTQAAAPFIVEIVQFSNVSTAENQAAA